MMAEKKPQDQINKELREKWDELEFDSQLIRAGEDPYPSTTHSLRVPLYATKSYVYSSLTELLKHHYFYCMEEKMLYPLLLGWQQFILLVRASSKNGLRESNRKIYPSITLKVNLIIFQTLLCIKINTLEHIAFLQMYTHKWDTNRE